MKKTLEKLKKNRFSILWKFWWFEISESGQKLKVCGKQLKGKFPGKALSNWKDLALEKKV